MSELDPTDLVALDKAKRAEDERAKSVESLEIEDFKWLMSTKRGRRMVLRLLDETGVFRTSYDGATNQTMFNEGQRNVGLRYMAKLTEHTPEQFAAMVTERKL